MLYLRLKKPHADSFSSKSTNIQTTVSLYSGNCFSFRPFSIGMESSALWPLGADAFQLYGKEDAYSLVYPMVARREYGLPLD